ncbi:glycosyltransferase 87 family protein [Streptomyces sp. NPDC092296]|uniref:glycosyltransferase 87 family protein n=1 Tax=Streptomyces sp. NPDC092296 TaxID=3366012 RepID=UPI00382B5CB1
MVTTRLPGRPNTATPTRPAAVRAAQRVGSRVRRTVRGAPPQPGDAEPAPATATVPAPRRTTDTHRTPPAAAALAARRWAQVTACLVAAGWAAVFPLTSGLPNQRTWGTLAAGAYLLAALAAALLPRRRAGRTAALIALAGATVLPLAVLALQGHRQSEVWVVERSAQLLLHTGSPYLAHPVHVSDYNPYLPAMALFGLPRALLGGGGATVGSGDGGLIGLLGDARLWFAAAFLLCMAVTWRLLRPRGGGSPAAPLAALTASPLVALPLAVGGVDLPLIGVCCLGLALAGRGRPIGAGLVLALACGLKWTAWPALPVALVLLWAAHGRRAAARSAVVALAGCAVAVVPFALTAPRAMLEQVIRFPLGMSRMRTPASSPLPGRLIAETGPGGHVVCLVLLCLSGAAVAGWLLLRPPLTAVRAADQLAVGLATAFLLAPAGRFGYLALPAILALWSRLAVRSGRAAAERPLPVTRTPERVGS